MAGHNEVGKRTSPKCTLIGNTNEAVVRIGDVDCVALLDTGSMVTNVSSSFYRKNLAASYTLHQLDRLLRVEAAGGHILDYLGYIEVPITIPKTKVELWVPVLVTPDTSYNHQVPLLIGTNVLSRVTSDQVKNSGNDVWNSSISCLTKSLQAEDWTIYAAGEVVVPAGQSVITTGRVGGEVRETNGVAQAVDTLTGGLIMPQCVVEVDKDRKAKLQITNISGHEIRIPKNQKIASFQQATILTPSSKSQQTQQSSTGPVAVDLEESCLSEEQKSETRDRIEKWKNVFASGPFELGRMKQEDPATETHHIRLTDPTPFKDRARRIPPGMFEEVKKHIEDMLACGAIRESNSPWSSNVVLVRKKDGSLRLCIDYRKLNERTIRDAYQLPRIDETLDKLAGAKIFSSFDLQAGYWQIEMAEEDKQKTAFSVSGVGFYECERMPFGLTNAPSTFQRLMESTLKDSPNCLVYLDDIVIFSRSYEEHWKHLEDLFRKLEKAGLLLKPSKCKLFRSSVKYLGHVISEDGIATDPEKTKAVQELPIPTNVHELRSTIGFLSYYRRFVKDFAQVAKPLHDLLKGHENKKNANKKTPIEMTPEATAALNMLKERLVSPPILGYADYTLPFEVHIDASGSGLGAVLYQTQDNIQRVIAYASRSIKDSERNYPAHKLEFLALKWAICDKFHDYLYGHQFSVVTDNNPLSYVLTTAKLDATGHRWLAELSNYNFSISYRSGKQNTDADFLSRLPAAMGNIQMEVVEATCQSIRSEAIQAPEYEDITCQSQQSTRVNWVELQGRDPTLKRLREELKTGNKPSRAAQAQLLAMSPDFKIYLRDWEKLLLKDDIVYRRRQTDREEIHQLVLPLHKRKEALVGLHDQVGHMGRDRTLELATSRFFWPGIQEEVKTHVKNCLACIKRKVSTPDRAPLMPIRSTQPMELVCIDYLKIEPSKGGVEDLLVITDHFTKFAHAIPTRNQSAKTTAKALLTFFLNFGFPQKLHSDQGRNFESKIIKELCELTGIMKTRTTPYHPAGNGQCERLNQTILNMLGTLEDHQKADWKSYVPVLTHAYNATRHESTKFTPFYLMFGRHPRLPLDLAFGLTSEEEPKDDSMQHYTNDLKQKLEEAYKVATQEATKSSSKHKKYYDRKIRGATVQVGDRVLVRNVGLRGKQKLANKWEDEVYKVLEQPSEEFPVFVVRREDGVGRKRTLHRNNLLPVNYLPLSKPERREKKKEKQTAKLPEPALPMQEAPSSESGGDSEEEQVGYYLRPRLNPRAPAFIPREEAEQRAASESPSSSDEESQQNTSEGEEEAEQTESSSSSEEEEPQQNTSEEEDERNQSTREEEVARPPERDLPRRSTRVRRQPEWLRSGDYLVQQQYSDPVYGSLSGQIFYV